MAAPSPALVGHGALTLAGSFLSWAAGEPFNGFGASGCLVGVLVRPPPHMYPPRDALAWLNFTGNAVNFTEASPLIEQ